MKNVSREARQEVVEAIRDRYRKATKEMKGKILNEFVAVSGFHRKHAVRVLNSKSSQKPKFLPPSKRIYSEAVKSALIILWEAADRICGKRLKAAIPLLLKAMEKHKHLQLDVKVRDLILDISPATIDRMLAQIRKSAGTRRRKKRARGLSKSIPIKTHHDWKDPLPGFLEIDFVVHGGGSMSGEYVHSLVATDVYSGWTEAVPLLAREQSLVVEGLKQIGRQMPMPILGINSDNDGAFLNDTLTGYCEREKILFTRSRVHHKNDQAWIEQKNGAVIRRTVGHARFAGVVAGQAMAQLYQVLRLHVNIFQPSLKLRERIQEGSKTRKIYFPPATPCQRLLEHPSIEQAAKDKLTKQVEQLDPVRLLHRIRDGQMALAALSNGNAESTLNNPQVEEFLSQLPTLWQRGEVRATHRRSNPNPRYWRTREDPFSGVWAEILIWLQGEPDLTAMSILDRLRKHHPGKYETTGLRTLQRRVKEWRGSMARNLIMPGIENLEDITAVSFSPHRDPVAAPLPLATLASVPQPQDPDPS